MTRQVDRPVKAVAARERKLKVTNDVNRPRGRQRQRRRGELERLRLLLLAAQRDGSRRFSEALRPARLSPSQAEILGVIASDGPLSLRDLGRRIVCESGSPSRAVDLLVRRGLVARVQSTHDRRFVELDLTDEARTLLPTLASGVDSLDRLLTERLDDAEIDTLALLLTRVLAGTDGLAAIELRCGPVDASASG